MAQNSILKISDEKTLQLIELYQKEECLWNTHLNDYKDRYKRTKAAERIARALALKYFGPRLVMTKLKNLRNSYNQELKKIAHSLSPGSQFEEVYKPRVCWFSKMDSFLRPYVKQARNCPLPHGVKIEKFESNITEDNNEDNRKIIKEEDSEYSVKQEPEIDLFEDHEEEIDTTEDPFCSINDESSNNDNKRRKISGDAKRSKFDDNETKDSMKLNQLVTNEDCYDTFGKYIAALLRSLPPQKALELQPKIVSVIVSAGLGYHEARVSQSDERNPSDEGI